MGSSEIGRQSRSAPVALVVDRNWAIRRLICELLFSERYRVLESDAGACAMELVREHHPAVVILDGRITGPDGFTVCELIKQEPRLRDIRIIMVTAEPRDRTRALRAGADRYLSKPFNPVRLLQIIDELLSDTDPRPRDLTLMKLRQARVTHSSRRP